MMDLLSTAQRLVFGFGLAGLVAGLGLFATCVSEGDRPGARDGATDGACADRCSEIFPDPAPCVRTWWRSDTCRCELVLADDDAPCDDDNACTLEDRCDGGRCAGELVDLGTHCDDGDACTNDVCDQRLGCVHDPVALNRPCDDGNVCTFDSRCNGLGECQWQDQYVCGLCDPRDPLACASEDLGQDLCDGSLVCRDGFCQVDPATVPRCDDPRLDPCLVPSCHDGDCTATALPDGTPCSDRSSCTRDDVCRAGVCTGTPTGAPECACVYAEDCRPLDDDDRCNGAVTCRDDVCVFDFASIVVCDTSDDDACSATRCVPKSGACELVVTPDDEPCDDGDPCTLDDTCRGGVCAGASADCSDLDGRCLVGRCDRLLGCTADVAPAGSPCRASTPCSPAGACDDSGNCVAAAADCDDGDPCTVDACAADGMTCVSYGPDEPACAAAGVCAAGVPLACDRGEYVCDYASVAGWSPIERCDGRDDDCDGETDERCIAEEACVGEATVVGAWGGAMQACAGAATAAEARCGSGWHVCEYSGMVEALDGERPPPRYYLAASIAFTASDGYRVRDSDGVCVPFEGACAGNHVVQAMTWDGVFAAAIAYATPAWGCDGGVPAGSCASATFDGVMCCIDVCDEDADCRDADPCSLDRCVAGRCDSARPADACPDAGVCGGLLPRCSDAGVLVCDTATLEGFEAIERSCDGLDNDCDGLTDGADPDLAALEVLCERQLGVCAGATAGRERCAGGVLSACEASDYSARSGEFEDGVETLCDGLDNDCDGLTDEAFAWQGKPLGAACDGVGACGAGVVECAPSRATATCSTNALGSASEARAELCNGEDDDCDGRTDEADDLDALDDLEGAAACPDTGVCAGLVQASCVEGAWRCDTAAIDGFGEERCDALDNDCDGLTDEGLVTASGAALGAPCGPASCPNGVVMCAADGSAAVCSSDVASDLELCDGRDNDCDGLTDEGILYNDTSLGARALGESCSGVGACGPGVVECGPSNKAICSTHLNGSQSQVTVERCNGADDDCDGASDEGFAWQGRALGAACRGLGECGAGTVVCAADGARATCSTQPDGGASEAVAEACNGRDDDCDGATDEGVSPGPDDCPSIGVCRPAILEATCLGESGWRCDFSASPYYQPDDETGRCDRLDNDCDGLTDEDFAALGQACDGPDADTCTRGTVVCDTGDPTRTTCSGDAATAETCNGEDDDCDGATDEAGAGGCTVYYRDHDRDGYGASEARCTCAAVVDFDAVIGTDCDDGETAIHPGAAERCNGVDDDCDGKTDGGDAADLLVGDPAVCELQEGVCAGSSKAAGLCVGGAWMACRASDYQAHSAAYQSGAESRCDGLDNDCDGAVDAADPDLAAARPLCEKQAGVCAGAKKPVSLCGASGWGSCGDAVYAAHSASYQAGGAETLCDGLDDDCDGIADDDFAVGGKRPGESCDGVGACGLGTVECTSDARGATCSTNPDGAQRQDKPETCNGQDDDCDGLTDEGLGLADSPCRVAGVCAAGGVMASCVQGAWSCDYTGVAYYESPKEASCDGRDNDCDGATDDDMTLGEGGQTLHKGDPCGSGGCLGAVICNNATQAPGDLVCSSSLAGGGELCDGQDNDCDGQSDEGLTWTPPGGQPLALGASCDGIGACGLGVVECDESLGTTCSTNADGTESEASAETCNGIDDDCDGATDEGFAWSGKAVGAACDGVGACGAGAVECLPNTAGATCSTNPNGSARQDTAEVCDGEDDDCDGATDDGLAIADSTCRVVGVCTTTNVVATCHGASGWSCDYSNVGGYHAGDEIGFCDGRDNDCDGQTDEDFPELGQACDRDDDQDACAYGTWLCGDEVVNAGGGAAEAGSGVPVCTGDSESPEVCGGGDEDCDGASNEEGAGGCVVYYRDHDGDGYGRQGDQRCLCGPSGEHDVTATSFDCDDDVQAVHPGAGEVCNDIDDDCDQQTDEDDAAGCLDYYYDGDEDGWGVTADSRCLCAEEDGVVTGHTTPLDDDCDDALTSVHPTADELCDGIDNDCDDASDDDDRPAVGCETYYYDGDGDDYGVTADSQCRCQSGQGYTATLTGDCCDSDNRTRTGQTAWYASADTCGSYDYDCSTEDEREHTATGSCVCPQGLCTLGGCTLTPGWADAVPSCGGSGQYVVGCLPLCLVVTETRTQRCH